MKKLNYPYINFFQGLFIVDAGDIFIFLSFLCSGNEKIALKILLPSFYYVYFKRVGSLKFKLNLNTKLYELCTKRLLLFIY